MERVISGIILIPAVIAAVYFGPPLLILGLVAVITMIGLYEYFSMIDNTGIDGYPKAGYVLGLMLVACFFFDNYYLVWLSVALVSLPLVWYFTDRNIKIALDQISNTFFGIVYVAGLMGFLLLIHRLENGPSMILFLFAVIWMGDISAYYVGKNLGRIPLAPTISPGKTLEGSVAGLAGSLAGGLACKYWIYEEISLAHCLIVALICGIIGQIGDLTESVLKRSTGVKDSGNLIPGHGGVLDRIDSLLFAGPALYCYHILVLQPGW